ncbi:hypothetical protein ACLK1T_09925 [Escherichia coli]
MKERKGEHTKTLQNLASQGYIRARIDGVVVIFPIRRNWNCKKKHTIEVVVDCFKVRDDDVNVWPSRLKPRYSFPVVPR